MRLRTPTPRKALLLLAWALLGAVGDASVEPTPQQEPVQCWWRTSAGAVRVAEPFTLLLTCSIVDSDRVTVDQAKLAPEAIPLSPFEVIGGGSLTESRSGNQSFFQRLYQVRILTDAVGEDVQVPLVVVSYQLERESSGGRARGIERRHELPALPMRVVSLVPAGADDIREAVLDTFEAIDDDAFVASLYSAVGLVLMGIGAIGLIVALATGFRTRDPKHAGPPGLEDRLILRHVGRELEDIRAARDREGWTSDLVGRAIASTRVVASYVTDRPLSLRPVEAHDRVPAGALVHSDNRGRRTLIASSVTASAVRGDKDARWTAIRDALTAFTQAHYGREEPPDAGPLDAAIDAVLAAVSALKREHAWTTRTRASAAARLRAIRVPWFR